MIIDTRNGLKNWYDFIVSMSTATVEAKQK